MGKHRPSPDGRSAADLIALYRPEPETEPAPSEPTTGRLPRIVIAGAIVGVGLTGVSGSSPPDPASASRTSPISVEEILRDRHEMSEAFSSERLGQLAASRNARDAEQLAAAEVQQAAEVAAQEAQAVAEAAHRDPEPVEAHEAATEAVVTAGEAPAVTGAAEITNSNGPVSSRVQAAADAVVRDVPGALGITMGGTRGSAVDPAGHPSGNAVDYMVHGDSDLGDRIVAYHVANWDSLGVDYIIWQQRILTSPGGSWQLMEDRGGTTANHMDHPHVNYVP